VGTPPSLLLFFPGGGAESIFFFVVDFSGRFETGFDRLLSLLFLPSFFFPSFLRRSLTTGYVNNGEAAR